jgi:DNA-binding transcriptional LysR family regulator
VQAPGFDPASARRAFCLASPDLFDVLAVPPLLQRIRQEAPGVDIVIVPLNERQLAEQLETGEVDVAIVPQVTGARAQRSAAAGLVRRTLFRDRFNCLLRAAHPALAGKRRERGVRAAERSLTLEKYVSLSHALVSPGGSGRGLVDRLLEERGLSRRVALRVPHFYSALAIVANSDLILTAPTALANLAPRDMPVIAVAAPLPLPDHSVHLVWHERFTNDPGHTWLRTLLAEVAPAAQSRMSEKPRR